MGSSGEGIHFIIQFPLSVHLLFIYLNDHSSSRAFIQILLLYRRHYSQHHGYRKKTKVSIKAPPVWVWWGGLQVGENCMGTGCLGSSRDTHAGRYGYNRIGS